MASGPNIQTTGVSPSIHFGRKPTPPNGWNTRLISLKRSQPLVYWYDDGPWGGCRIPLSWGVQYRDQSGRWREVVYEEKPESVKDALNQVKFQPVSTHGVRLYFDMPEKESVAFYEFEVK